MSAQVRIIAIVARYDVVAAGLIALLHHEEPNLEVTQIPAGSLAPAKAADDSATTAGPGPGAFDVVLYDISAVRADDGAELARLRGSKMVVIAVVHTARPSPELVSRLGADGHVSIAATATDLLAAITTAHRARTKQRDDHVRPQRTRRRTPSDRTTAVALTDREQDMLALIAQGLNNNEIATRLYLTVNTIKSHNRRLYRKIGATSRASAIAWGTRHGFFLEQADHQADH